MWAILRANPLAFALAILLHLGVLAVLIFSLDWESIASPDVKKIDVVQASVVDTQKIQRQRDKQKAVDDAKKLKAKQERDHEQKRKQEAEKKKQLEAQREKDQVLEKKRAAEAKKKQLADKKRKTNLAAKKKKVADAKKKTEANAKRKKAAEAKKKAVEAKKKADAERERKAREKGLSDKLAAEETQRLVDHYAALIQQKIQRNWRQPQNVPSGLASKIEVRLIPGGEVAGVRTIKSSGNTTFDDSVEKAVLKASPLPLPDDPKEFNTFRVLNFVFKDEN